MDIWSVKDTDPKKLADAFRQGMVIVCPTDTVYGLLADATNEEAVRRVYEIKKRDEGKPLPVFVDSIEMAERYANIDSLQTAFLMDSWPGKVTAVMYSKGVLSSLFDADGTIGMRMPKYDLVLETLKELGSPLTGTSANISGEPPTGSFKEVSEGFLDPLPDIMIDAGDLPRSDPSQVVDITAEDKKVLRP